MLSSHDTIAAIATPPGRGGVGIIRVSGAQAANIAQQMIGQVPVARYAHFTNFYDNTQQVIDSGLALLFPNPHSFTGEDVLELQAHGGPVIMDILLKRVLECGARMARPGEFSERAFLNDKIDLAQAEAIADLINAASEQAARSATRSLQGEFSQKINALVEALIHLRMYVEAAIDFPEEEIDFLSDGKIAGDLEKITLQLAQVLQAAQQGTLLRDGMTVVIAGKPNAGKSSLLNKLSGRESAIVTDIAGTTRDILREHIQLDGLPLHIIDTAGLRDSSDQIEQEGIRRAWHEIEGADAILLVIDSTQQEASIATEYKKLLSFNKPVIIAWNKIDAATTRAPQSVDASAITIKLSAKTGQGLDELKQALKTIIGFNDAGENNFIARRRHLDALLHAQAFLAHGTEQLEHYKAGELLAEELQQAQNALSEITGSFTSDDLLGKIFSSFCIGK